MGVTPLHFAALNDSLEIASLLLLCDADPALEEADDNMTPIDVALQLGHSKVANLMLNFFHESGQLH